jgi:hypothetical protein
MKHFHLWFHTSSWDSITDPSTGSVIELSGVIAPTIITLNGAVLEIPFIDIAASIFPSGP